MLATWNRAFLGLCLGTLALGTAVLTDAPGVFAASPVAVAANDGSVVELTRPTVRPPMGHPGEDRSGELRQGTAGLIADARFEVIDGAGHLPCVEAPADYARILTRFLTEIGHV